MLPESERELGGQDVYEWIMASSERLGQVRVESVGYDLGGSVFGFVGSVMRLCSSVHGSTQLWCLRLLYTL